jgi:L-threonylcarbamoyladenylate synthase
MSVRFDCAVPEQRATGIAQAVSAVRRGELVVLPTDTVYGVGADAFTPAAVAALLFAKGRGRDLPVPVLVGSWRTLDGLVDNLPAAARELVEMFWPGALTIVLRHTAALAWDLGESRGTVAVRMPMHPVAIELLTETGPLAVSSANRTGMAPARTADEAQLAFGGAVSVYLDGGACADPVPSTIVDLTGSPPRLLRAGAVEVERLRAVLPDLADTR